MKSDKSDAKKISGSPFLPGAKKVSRRTVIKGLLLVPVQLNAFLSAVKAEEKVQNSPGRDIMGNPYPGQADDPFAPNRPIGKAQGIIPGRVAWVWDPSSTNPDCANKPLGTGVTEYDAWFMDKNTSQEAVDRMLAAGLASIAGKEKPKEIWDTLFRFHNLKRGKGNVAYQKGEKIYIKLNRTSASGGIGPGYARLEDNALPLSCETSPQIVTSILRQLVQVAGVPQECIYVGDALRNIYQDEYIKYHDEFPDVNYLSSIGANTGRIACNESSKDLIFYSDNKSVMSGAGSDKIFTVLEDAEYLINLAAMKGHNIAGITLCAKNHFGTQTRRSASHLHPGLKNNKSMGYGQYRVLVDLIGNRFTGGKNLFYILDALWSGSNWNGLPVKFLMPPFNNHWCSSLLLSHDPVAIESVGYDFLRSEFSYPEHTAKYILDKGVDDYLHQAADSANWPSGIVYRPNGDGIPIPDSLGVHEHWNNQADKKYSRNLGTGQGIELVKIFQGKRI